MYKSYIGLIILNMWYENRRDLYLGDAKGNKKRKNEWTSRDTDNIRHQSQKKTGSHVGQAVPVYYKTPNSYEDFMVHCEIEITK